MAELASGVYYHPQDYAGITRRLLIDAVDLPAALVLTAAAVMGLLTIAPSIATPGSVLLLGYAVWFSYFVLLKRSSVRTPGYIVAGARIVDLRGDRPSIVSLVVRLCFVAAGPLNFLVDLFWLTGDPNRQAIRDKYAGTYVIKKDATPSGTGAIVFRTYMFWGMTFLFREVKRRAP